MIGWLFGCSHERYSWPVTLRCPRTGRKQPMRVACLTCGKEAEYDWLAMRPIWNPKKTQVVRQGLIVRMVEYWRIK